MGEVKAIAPRCFSTLGGAVPRWEEVKRAVLYTVLFIGVAAVMYIALRYVATRGERLWLEVERARTRGTLFRR